MFTPMLKLAFVISWAFMPVHKTLAGSVTRGGNCTIANNRLDPATHKLLTDCDDKTFCTPQNTCEPRQCRKDEYPFGYDPGEPLPPMCTQGQYCPDEGDACRPWLSLGQTCQLNRDGASNALGAKQTTLPVVAGFRRVCTSSGWNKQDNQTRH